MGQEPAPVERLRAIALALPEAHEVTTWEKATFRVRNKIFALHTDASDRLGKGRPAVWLKAAPGDQESMTAAAPDCFFAPPYLGPKGWVGVWLDGVVDWEDVGEFVRDSYRLVAPKRLGSRLDAEPDRDA